MTDHRRRFLIQSAGAAALLSAWPYRPTAASEPAAPASPLALSSDALLLETQRRTFRYFWETTEASRGLAPDFAPEPSPASVAAMGFALTAVPIGIEHGWITREAGAQRVANTLRFLWEAPQGSSAQGCAGYKGFFYHFLDMVSGTRYRNSELSSIDTALLLMGVRCCGQYFLGEDATEHTIRLQADALCERVEWRWLQVRGALISMGWKPESGFLPADWAGYCEAIPLYLLTLGSVANAVSPEAWNAWTAGYSKSWGTVQGIEHLTFSSAFVHQFPQVWLDLKGPADAYMRERRLDYFENSRRAVLSQQAYGNANPLAWQGYGADLWGLSACDGPVNLWLPYRGESRHFRTYAARGVGLIPQNNYDDGTLTPAATLGSMPFAPDQVTAAAMNMYNRYGNIAFGDHGFLDSFNPSFTYDVPLHSGRRVAELGWVNTRYYGINQGPIIAMIENHKSGLIWRTMRKDPVMRRGLLRAGFTGGWLG